MIHFRFNTFEELLRVNKTFSETLDIIREETIEEQAEFDIKNYSKASVTTHSKDEETK